MSNFWGEGEGHSHQKRCPPECSRGGGKAFWLFVDESQGSALSKGNTRHSMWVGEVGPITDVCVFMPYILVRLRNLGLI